MITGSLDPQCFSLEGHTLSSHEEAALRCSFVTLQQDSKAAVSFFGKVFGTQRDYLIARIHNSDIISTKQYVYSVDSGLSWHTLDSVSEEQAGFCRHLVAAGLFVGDPAFEYFVKDSTKPLEVVPADVAEEVALEEEDARDEEEEEEMDVEGDEGDGELFPRPDLAGQPEGDAPKSKKPSRPAYTIVAVSEATRLAAVVEAIDEACYIAPRGMVTRDANGVVSLNASYAGLAAKEAGKLTSYFHLRAGSGEEMTKLQKLHLIDRYDAFTSLAADSPSGLWTLRFEPTTGRVIGSSFLYPGYAFYVKPDSNAFGQVYFGYGDRNSDLPFVL